MRLEKIVLNGFKSFAEKTEFVFDESITAIVGPNGCGKSNVVDAVKWVLGEQSKKSLRSSQMTDVIFSGSSTRKPSGMSEVSMFFSGVSDSSGEGSTDLQITRRLYRNGDSCYLINNKAARLKDIRERFMDTGIGVSAYSIIEQGQIAQLLTASKTERRLIFEEAAGISKYKAHKKEAARKLEKTEQRMLRVADVFNELQKQLRSVRLQAGKAKNYVEYKKRLDKLRMSYSLAEYHELKERAKTSKERLDSLNDSFSEVVSEIAKNDTENARLQDSIVSQENQINETDRTLISIISKIEQKKDRIEYLQKRAEELKQRKTTAADRIHFLEEQSTKFDGQIEGCKYRLKENEKTAEEKGSKLSEMQEMMRGVNMECADINAELEEEKATVLETVRKSAQLKNELESIQNYRQNLTNQYEKAKEKAASIEKQLNVVSSDKITYQQSLETLTERIDHLQQALDAKDEMMEQISDKLAENNNVLASLRQDKSAVDRELHLLVEMENKREGVGKAVKEVLELKDSQPEAADSVECLLAEIIETDTKYATALEAILEEKADWLVINNTDKFLEQSREIAENGRINALSLEDIAEEANQEPRERCEGKRAFIELIKTEDRYRPLLKRLLRGTYLADNVQEAVAASKAVPECCFVTVNGELASNGYIIKTGNMGKNTALISRKSRMNELESEIEAINGQIENVQSQIDEDTTQNNELAAQSRELREAMHQANSEKVDAQTKLQVVTQSIENLEKDLPAAKKEAEDVNQQIEDSYEKQKTIRKQLNETEEAGSRRNEKIEELQALLDEKKSLHDELSSQLTELRIAIGQTTVTRNAITQEINSLKAQMERAKIALQSASNDLTGNDEQVNQTRRNILDIESEISELYAQKEKAQLDVSRLRKETSSLVETRQQIERKLSEYRSRQSELEKQIHSLDLQLNEIRIKSEDLVQRVAEELELDLEQEYNGYEHQSDVDWQQVKEEINELKGKISRLGNVNVDAIDELAELEEREKFLSEQIEDLDKSKSQLQQLINKINKDSREKFRLTFEQVRNNFKEIFRKLFGGGKGDIMLDIESDEDILECGIEIIAQPPGKGAKSISLLSGGEKTMTAIALQFAIFKTKPSPFCFLDEVDAALDEANNERFNLIVKEFEQYSQFIIITHAKRTMSIADKLFGVTMQQQGVSKQIMVRFDKENENNPVEVA